MHTNAYYSVCVAEEHRKYLRFIWRNKVYQYTCLAQGLASAPRIFTKLLKPVFATLNRLGRHVIIGYIDDSLLLDSSVQECSDHVSETLALVESLGFVVNYEKSVLVASTKIIFLGNVIDSKLMIVFLTDERKLSILDA